MLSNKIIKFPSLPEFPEISPNVHAYSELTQQLGVRAQQELVEDVVVALAGGESGHARLKWNVLIEVIRS